MTDSPIHVLSVQARTTAAALAAGRQLDPWSLAFVVVALAVLPWSPDAPSGWATACLLLSLAAGIVQKYYALRVAFDAMLFRQLGDTWSSGGRDDAAAALAPLDQALATAGLGKPRPGAPRDFAGRQLGARRLLYGQAGALAFQLVTLIAALTALRPG